MKVTTDMTSFLMLFFVSFAGPSFKTWSVETFGNASYVIESVPAAGTEGNRVREFFTPPQWFTTEKLWRWVTTAVEEEEESAQAESMWTRFEIVQEILKVVRTSRHLAWRDCQYFYASDWICSTHRRWWAEWVNNFNLNSIILWRWLLSLWKFLIEKWEEENWKFHTTDMFQSFPMQSTFDIRLNCIFIIHSTVNIGKLCGMKYQRCVYIFEINLPEKFLTLKFQFQFQFLIVSLSEHFMFPKISCNLQMK